MRRRLAARGDGDEAAGLAIAVYLHRLRAKIAAMMAATGGTDALVFTGGVGESAGPIRAEACAGLDWLGVSLDRRSNDAVDGTDAIISSPGASHECHQLLGTPHPAVGPAAE